MPTYVPFRLTTVLYSKQNKPLLFFFCKRGECGLRGVGVFGNDATAFLYERDIDLDGAG